MLKKIGIITINDFNNYGNRLQCYSVQSCLEKLGCKTENIYNTGRDRKKIFKEKIKNYLKYILKHKKEKIITERKKYFREFNKVINFSKYRIINGKANKSINNAYDFFIVGSDQVWNPNFDSTSEADFLFFSDDEKKISYSASFGVSELPIEKRQYYKERLDLFKSISVRENAGKKIIENLGVCKKIEVLVDPTMLLSSEEWDKVSNKPKQLKAKKYILNYFLGKLPDEWRNEIDRIAKENDCEIINILDENDPIFVSGPSEFLYLEKNAFMVCTDSFHSSVFAIIYNTPFVVFDRQDKHVSMNSRLDTLLSKFNLQNRRFNGKITEDLLMCDYTEAKEILEIEKEKSLNFLKDALDIDK